MAIRNPNPSTKGMVGTTATEDERLIRFIHQIFISEVTTRAEFIFESDREKMAKVVVNYILKGRHLTESQLNWLTSKLDSNWRSLVELEFEDHHPEIRKIKQFGDRKAAERTTIFRRECERELPYKRGDEDCTISVAYADILKLPWIAQELSAAAATPSTQPKYEEERIARLESKLDALLREFERGRQVEREMLIE